jgi:hypothetical protein
MGRPNTRPKSYLQAFEWVNFVHERQFKENTALFRSNRVRLKG